MATKDDLGNETAELKTELAELQAEKSAPKPKSIAEESAKRAAAVEAQADDARKDELKNLADDLSEVLEEHPTTKTLLLILGVFAAGYLLGRSR